MLIACHSLANANPACISHVGFVDTPKGNAVRSGGGASHRAVTAPHPYVSKWRPPCRSWAVRDLLARDAERRATNCRSDPQSGFPAGLQGQQESQVGECMVFNCTVTVGVSETNGWVGYLHTSSQDAVVPQKGKQRSHLIVATAGVTGLLLALLQRGPGDQAAGQALREGQGGAPAGARCGQHGRGAGRGVDSGPAAAPAAGQPDPAARRQEEGHAEGQGLWGRPGGAHPGMLVGLDNLWMSNPATLPCTTTAKRPRVRARLPGWLGRCRARDEDGCNH